MALAQQLADGPTFAHGMTKTMLHQEWSMGSTRRSRPRRRRRRSACRPTTSTRLSRLRRQAETGLRGQLIEPDRSFLALAVLRGPPPRAGRAAWTPGQRQHLRDRRSWRRRRRLPRAGRASSGATAGSSTRAPGDDPSDSSTCARSASIRETLARHAGLADFAFAMQGLGAGAISLFGTPEQQAPMAAEDPRRRRRSPPSR